MKKLTLLSIVAATVLFVGCGDDTKKAASEATTKAVETTKEAAADTGSAVKEVADKTVEAIKEAGESISDATDKAVEATKEAAVETKEAASKVVESAKEGVATATAAVAEATGSSAGAAAYKKCAGCHGVDGKTKALGKSAVIAGQSKDDLVAKIGEYKAGTRNVSGMGTLMKGQVASLSDEDIQAVAEYISALK